MKLNFRLRHACMVFWAVVIGISVVRAYQIWFVRDISILSQWGDIECACVIAAVVASALIILMLSLSKIEPLEIKIKKNNLLSRVSYITTLAVTVCGVGNIYEYMVTSRDRMLFLMGVAAILSAGVFAIIGYSFAKGKNIFGNCKLLPLLPVLWYVTRLMWVFFYYNTTASALWYMSDEIALVFGLLFMFMQARLFSQIDYNNPLKRIYIYGLISPMFILIYNSRIMIEKVNTMGYLSFDNIAFNLADVVIAVYMIVFAINVQKGIVDTNKTQDDAVLEGYVMDPHTQGQDDVGEHGGATEIEAINYEFEYVEDDETYDDEDIVMKPLACTIKNKVDSKQGSTCVLSLDEELREIDDLITRLKGEVSVRSHGNA